MGEALKSEVKIPVWMFSIILVLMLAILGFNASFAGTVQQVKTNTIEIEKKANQSDVDRIYNKLDKIETLLIDHMKEKK
jgi:hypothetical protein